MQDQEFDLNPGKGINLPMTGAFLEFIKDALVDVSEAWTESNTPDQFWHHLTSEWGNVGSAGKMGDKTWTAFKTSPIRGQELRVSVTRSLKGQFGLDVRLWWS